MKAMNCRGNGCLDSMRASSPPHRSSKTSAEYKSWMLKYPSALTFFKQITNRTKGRKLAIFLDYDGTLSPIVDNPDCAYMSNSMRDAVRNVAKHFPTAIISGRSIDKVYGFVGLAELYYAGSHGMDIIGPKFKGKEVHVVQPAHEFLPMINEVFRSLVKITKDIKGAKVENNKYCVSVHYRNVDEKDWTTIGQSVSGLLNNYPHLRLTHGRKVLEVRPDLNWDKGKAVEFLLESLGLSNSKDVLPIYIGDDRTDEDAFKVLKEGNKGLGILVSCIPKESHALYSLQDPIEVMEFLKCLVVEETRS